MHKNELTKINSKKKVVMKVNKHTHKNIKINAFNKNMNMDNYVNSIISNFIEKDAMNNDTIRKKISNTNTEKTLKVLKLQLILKSS